MARVTTDVYRLKWEGEIIDTFPRGGLDWKSRRKYALKMLSEYSIAYQGGVTIHHGRDKHTSPRPMGTKR